MNPTSAGKIEKQWLEEAREFRLARVKNLTDAIRWATDFGVRISDHKIVFRVRKDAGLDDVKRKEFPK
jgi:hypothetical protein